MRASPLGRNPFTSPPVAPATQSTAKDGGVGIVSNEGGASISDDSAWRDARGPTKPREIRPLSEGELIAVSVMQGQSLTPQAIEAIANNRQARLDFFKGIEGSADKTTMISALQTLIAAEGPPSFWFARKRAFACLRGWSAAPLSVSLSALATTKDDSLKSFIVSTVLRDLSFPLAPHMKEEIHRIGPLGGQLWNTLLASAPGIGERATWISSFPRVVRAWILACAAVGVGHGVDPSALRKFSREAGGPLNDWHIRHAVEPLSPLSWGGVQALTRRVIRF